MSWRGTQPEPWRATRPEPWHATRAAPRTGSHNPSAANAALSMLSCRLLDGYGDDLLPGEALAATGRRWTPVRREGLGFR
jgi:hypothetical protein